MVSDLFLLYNYINNTYQINMSYVHHCPPPEDPILGFRVGIRVQTDATIQEIQRWIKAVIGQEGPSSYH